MDKITVILPVYKVEKYIHQCVDSILGQTYKNLEIILVDDGSPDKSGEICDEYAAQDNRVKVVHEENGGAPAARNSALSIATGEWITYVDPDDWLESNAYEEVMKVVQVENSDMILFNAYNLHSDGTQTIRDSFSSDFTTDDRNIIYELQLSAIDEYYAPFHQKSNQSFPWDKVYKRSMLEENHVLWPENLKANDDIVYIIQAFQYARKVSYINKELYHWRINTGSITQKYTPDRPQIDHDVYVELIKLRNKYGLGEEYNAALCARIIKNTWLCCGRCFFNHDNPETFFQRMKSVSKILNDKIVKTAFQKVNLNKLDRVERTMALFKNPRPIWLFFVYEAYEFKHKVLQR